MWWTRARHSCRRRCPLRMLTGRSAYPQKTSLELIAAILASTRGCAARPLRYDRRALSGEGCRKAVPDRKGVACGPGAACNGLTQPDATGDGSTRSARTGRSSASESIRQLLRARLLPDGLTEALITDLARIGSLRVISRYSVIQFKDGKTPLAKIARALRVQALVVGSVLRSGDRVRITANSSIRRRNNICGRRVTNAS